MKKLIISCLLSVLFISTTFAQYGTERTGYEGDYFSLEGALDLFKQSYTLRDFERKLNTKDNWVNNLDLNYDGRIDYIRVEHRRQGNFHAVILQALVDRYDIQDVAVIEIEITGNREAVLQIVGDEDLYGEEVIVEPREGYTDSRRGYNSDYGDFVNVYYWEPVQYILGRQYRVYASPYRWQYYPTWWSPWRQFTWSIFRPRIVIYHRHYHVVHRHRVIRVHNFYRTYRTYSYNVVQRTNKVRVRQGRAPINRPRPAVREDNRSRDNLSRNKVVERPRVTTRSSTPAQSPSVSRKRTETATDQRATRSSIPRVDQRSRSGATSPRTPRSTTPVQKPSVRSRNTSPATNQKATRSTAPQVKQPSRSTTPRSRTTTRPTPPTRKPSANSRTTPTARPKVNRNTPPRVNNQPSRNQPARSGTTTRSRTTTPNRTPSAGSSRSVPITKPKATRSTPSKSSGSKSRSRKRGGGEF